MRFSTLVNVEQQPPLVLLVNWVLVETLLLLAKD